MGLFKRNEKYATIYERPIKIDGKYISFGGKQYALNYQKLKDLCLKSSADGGTRENEISYVYEANEGELNVTSKVEHETKIVGIPQNDMIMYDIVKSLILSLLDNDKSENEFKWDFGTTLAVNTLISWGALEEVE